MIYHTRNCAICDCEIKTYLKGIGRNQKHRLSMKKHNKSDSHRNAIMLSDEGVYFAEGNVYFCNSCWDAIWKSEKIMKMVSQKSGTKCLNSNSIIK